MRRIKALITAGGQGTRLRPLTHFTNKHLLPLANEPMLIHAIRNVVKAGCVDIAININPGDTEIPEAINLHLQKTSMDKLTITFIEQKGGPLGLAHIIKNAAEWIGKDNLLFYLGDNILCYNLRNFVRKFLESDYNCMLTLSKVRDPQRFGVPHLLGKNIIRIDEKPRLPMSDFAVTGIYLYDQCILEAVNNITPSARGELEITDAHNYLLGKKFKVGYQIITGWWKDTGKPEDLLEGNALVLSQMEKSEIHGDVEPGVLIEGKVKIGKGSRIRRNSIVRGPVVIGDKCEIIDACIAPYTCLGDNVKVQETEIEHSIVLPGATIFCQKRIVESIIGEDCVITSKDQTWPQGVRLRISRDSQIVL